LRKDAHGTDLLIGEEDMAGKESVPFLILLFFLCSCVFLFNLLYLYFGVGKWASMAGSDLADLQVVGLAF
jgi:hypothetical protein